MCSAFEGPCLLYSIQHFSDGKNTLANCLLTVGVKGQYHKREEEEEEEIKKALDSMAKAKAAGPDGIVVEMLSALEEFGVSRITQLANKIYAEEHFPAEMQISLHNAAKETRCNEM